MFLKRNLKQMQKIRGKEIFSSTTVDKSSTLSITLVPQVNQIVYGPCKTGEDIFVMKNRQTKPELRKRMAQNDLQFSVRMG